MKVLVAASGGHEPPEPVTVASNFPWPKGSEVHVISVAEVVQPVMVAIIPDGIETGSVQIRTAAEAAQTATAAAQQFRDRGFTTEGVVAEGDPETAILDHAKRWGADVIVVGSRDKTLIERLLMGSIADRVIHHAPCSVLVVKQCDAST